MPTGGIILCGGQSRRMGRSKAMLPFGPERMLKRVVRRLGEAVGPIVVVAAVGQELPELDDDVCVVRDRRPNRGPLEGLAAGFEALAGRADAAFATGCDVPLLVPGFVGRLIDLAPGFDVVVPRIGPHAEPLAALYSASVLPEIEFLLAADRLRPAFLFERVATRHVSAGELSDVDPKLATLVNVNTPPAYRAALIRAGFDPPEEASSW